MIEFKRIDDPDRLIELYPLFKEMPGASTPSHVLFGDCLNGKYVVVEGLLDGVFAGFVAFRSQGTHMHIACLHMKNAVKEFKDSFWAQASAAGVKTVSSYSSLDIKAYEKVTGMTYKYSVYNKELV